MSASPHLVPKVPTFVAPLSERDLSESPSSTVVSIASFTGHVETTVQALRLIHAANQGIIPCITRQLNDLERETIRSGTILVISAGINQWTGMSTLFNLTLFLTNHRRSPLVSTPGCGQLSRRCRRCFYSAQKMKRI